MWLAVRKAATWSAPADAPARAPVHIDVPLLRTWSCEILGGPSNLRTTDAFAKGGAERYGTQHLSSFADAVAQAATHEHVLVRAARLYLDICFYHPFADGNGRLAKRTLPYLLGVDIPTRAVAVNRWAHDTRGPDALVRLLAVLQRKATELGHQDIAHP